MRILIIRHGDPDYANDTLTEKGHREASLLAQKLKNEKIDHIFCSPLGRAKDTCAYTAKALGKEIEELKEAQQSGDEDKITDELGDVLFSVVNISRFLGADSEEALTKSNNKFIERYLIVERLAKERDIDMPSSSIEELDKLWDEAKDIIRNQ
jgi:tetrapyrrole methylase family protein/MazG family protein